MASRGAHDYESASTSATSDSDSGDQHPDGEFFQRPAPLFLTYMLPSVKVLIAVGVLNHDRSSLSNFNIA